MLNTYRAVLRGDFLEWLYEQPQNLSVDQAVSVYVTILDQQMPTDQKTAGTTDGGSFRKAGKNADIICGSRCATMGTRGATGTLITR